jgi:putative membrane protein
MWHWGMGPYMMGTGAYWGWGLAWWLGGLALTVLFIVLVVRVAQSHPGHSHAGDSALEALKLRYARGEIQRDEYERIRKDLER